jgi:hypothetical protein
MAEQRRKLARLKLDVLMRDISPEAPGEAGRAGPTDAELRERAAALGVNDPRPGLARRLSRRAVIGAGANGGYDRDNAFTDMREQARDQMLALLGATDAAQKSAAPGHESTAPVRTATFEC